MNRTPPFLFRTSLLCLLCLGLLLSGCTTRQAKVPGSSSETQRGLELVILHVNDTHSHVAGIDKYGNASFSEAKSRGGYGRIAAAIRQAKAESDNVLALDAGDQFLGALGAYSPSFRTDAEKRTILLETLRETAESIRTKLIKRD